MSNSWQIDVINLFWIHGRKFLHIKHQPSQISSSAIMTFSKTASHNSRTSIFKDSCVFKFFQGSWILTVNLSTFKDFSSTLWPHAALYVYVTLKHAVSVKDTKEKGNDTLHRMWNCQIKRSWYVTYTCILNWEIQRSLSKGPSYVHISQHC